MSYNLLNKQGLNEIIYVKYLECCLAVTTHLKLTAIVTNSSGGSGSTAC